MAQFNSLIVTGDSRFLNPIKGNVVNGIYYVRGTQTSATASWTGVVDAPKLYTGMTIDYYLPYAGVASTNVTLNLTLSTGNTTGAKNVYISTGRLTTHFGAGRVIHMTYFEAGAISISGTATTDDRWICDAFYDTNSNTWRNITCNGTAWKSTGTGTGAMNFVNGSNINISASGNNLTIGVPATTTPTVTLSKTSGTWTAGSVWCAKWGNVVTINIQVKGTGATVNAGVDGFVGKISGVAFPKINSTLMGYTNSTALFGWLETSGNITIRASESTQVPSGNGLYVTGTYVCD